MGIRRKDKRGHESEVCINAVSEKCEEFYSSFGKNHITSVFCFDQGFSEHF